MKIQNVFLCCLILFPGRSYCDDPARHKNSGTGIEYSYSQNSDTSHFFQNASSPDKARTRLIVYSSLGLYPVTMYVLYTQWYKHYPQSRFHFFNDNAEWQQMDKFGHVWDTYSIAKPLSKTFRWAGYDNKSSTLYASGIAFLYQASLEVFDGFSSQWGFSMGDLLSNTLGILIFTSQQLTWQEQRITLKYSFHQTNYSQYRPDLLGSTLPENILKDYNGLTYWASINPHSFLPSSSKFPAWLSIAAGFGAEGMTGGRENLRVLDGKTIPEFARYRQYYIGIDFDLSRVKWKSKFLDGFFKVINIVRLPAPAVEFNNGHSTKFHWFYF